MPTEQRMVVERERGCVPGWDTIREPNEMAIAGFHITERKPGADFIRIRTVRMSNAVSPTFMSLAATSELVSLVRFNYYLRNRVKPPMLYIRWTFKAGYVEAYRPGAWEPACEEVDWIFSEFQFAYLLPPDWSFAPTLASAGAGLYSASAPPAYRAHPLVHSLV